MAKLKTTFFCQNCGAQHAKWAGQCHTCKEWNTIVEEVVQKEDKKDWKQGTPSFEKTEKRASKALKINEISTTPEKRLKTTIPSLIVF